jgi:hypothetical protein
MTPAIVGVMVVKDDDLWVERALRNVARFCDRIHVADNGSHDGTWPILERLAAEFDHMELERVADLRTTQRLVEPYVGSRTWVFGVDGDELYDPRGLEQLRAELLAGRYLDRFRVKSNVLNAVAVDLAARTATGYLAPPSRPITKLYNFAALDRWSGPVDQVLHGGDRRLRPGFTHDSTERLMDRFPWGESHFRCLHCCFVPRSSGERGDVGSGRPSPIDLAQAERASRRRPWRRLRKTSGSAWKSEKYRKGPLVTVDVGSFL